jgi:translation initiation factor IF-3
MWAQVFVGSSPTFGISIYYYLVFYVITRQKGGFTISTRGPITRNLPLINERIHAKEVRVISDDGQNLGVLETAEARRIAADKGLDLVLISPDQKPPVAKILDYGKFKFENEKKAREARKKQHTVDVKEIKMTYKIDVHDYNVRVKSATKFLQAGNKVKVVIKLKGREAQHMNLAFDLLNKFFEDLKELSVLDKKPSAEGRNVTMILSPDTSS